MNDISFSPENYGLLDLLPLGIIILRADMTVLHWNRCLEDWSGIKSEDICNTIITDFYHHLNQTKYLSRLESIFTVGHPVVFSAQLHKYFIPIEISDGLTRLQQTTITPIITADETLALVAIQDVTDPLISLAENRKMRSELEAVNKELDSFVYTASHDLKAPLRNVLGFVTLIEKKCISQLDNEGKEYFSFLSKAASRMSELLEDLLTLSRITRIKNPYEQVDIQALIVSVKERMSYDIESKQVIFRESKSFPNLQCDRIKITEVFANLIGNAIKFSDNENQGTPVIEINYQESSQFYEFEIKDNGIGIDPKNHERIFNIFQRLHTEDEYEGTGVGLHLCRKIVEEHQGSLRIESQLGKGTAFFFTISKTL